MAEVGGLAKAMAQSLALLENELVEKLWVLKALQHLSTSGLYIIKFEHITLNYVCFYLTMSRL